MESTSLLDLGQQLLANPVALMYVLQHANSLTLAFLFACAGTGRLRVSWRTMLFLVLAVFILGCLRL